MTQSFFTSSPGSQSPRSNLPRGKACMNCRRRKIKCDGHKPICSQCSRSPGTADDCEYPMEGRSRTQQLEETIKKLQTRIGELETTGHDSSILLHEPYDAGDAAFMGLEIPQFVDSWPPSSSVSTSPSSRVNTPTSASSSSTLVLEEPPSDVIERLVDTFLGSFSQVGFFLDPDTFRNSALLAFPFGHYHRPSPALLSAVYMWGSRLSPGPPHPVYNEDAFLVCTLQNIHQDLGGQHPQRVMHGIQAEVLLSFYYLTLGRPVEGIYHSSAAVSLAISAGLHLIKSSQLPLQPCFGVLETPLPPPTDALEEGERINAFWTVLVVNNYWVAAHGSPSAIPYHDTPIDTPWPLDVDDYASSVSGFSSYSTRDGAPMPDYQQLFGALVGGGGATVAKFLGGLNVDGFSALALLSKASILLERAITFSTRYSDRSDAEAFDSLDVILEQFAFSVPVGIELVGCAGGPKRSLVVTQTLTHAAIIRLHAHRIHTSDASRSKYLAAARAVVHVINDANLSQWRHIDPIMGILWTTVCEVFIAELSSMQSFGVVGRLTQQHQDISACLETVLSTMRMFAPTSPLIEYFSNRIEQAYSAITNSV
ncbi:Zn(2)-Cys(6) binuclear cluster domain-containing protein [Mycena vulgaris]|nr:Zn(2)-Cys(6) binuclear cluster domain-containing protein [Mycena vulgaris]KAJ6605604.1 Zn(2)-Cys(6) binuclear cluster domain-containing protein [Mycena vulgaris]